MGNGDLEEDIPLASNIINLTKIINKIYEKTINNRFARTTFVRAK